MVGQSPLATLLLALAAVAVIAAATTACVLLRRRRRTERLAEQARARAHVAAPDAFDLATTGVLALAGSVPGVRLATQLARRRRCEPRGSCPDRGRLAAAHR